MPSTAAAPAPPIPQLPLPSDPSAPSPPKINHQLKVWKRQRRVRRVFFVLTLLGLLGAASWGFTQWRGERAPVEAMRDLVHRTLEWAGNLIKPPTPPVAPTPTPMPTPEPTPEPSPEPEPEVEDPVSYYHPLNLALGRTMRPKRGALRARPTAAEGRAHWHKNDPPDRPNNTTSAVWLPRAWGSYFSGITRAVEICSTPWQAAALACL